MTGRLITLDERHRVLVHHLRDEAERWLAAKGTDQYRGNRAQYAHDALDRALNAGELVGWDVGGQVRAVAAVSGPDEDFWTEQEAAEPVAYLGRFMVAEHGHGWGEALLEAIAAREAARGRHALRLDCWRTNAELHAYYRRHGFRHVRTMDVPGRQSGALFERPLPVKAHSGA